MTLTAIITTAVVLAFNLGAIVGWGLCMLCTVAKRADEEQARITDPEGAARWT